MFHLTMTYAPSAAVRTWYLAVVVLEDAMRPSDASHIRSEDDGDAGASSKARERRVMKQRDIRDEGPIGPAQGAGLDRAVRTCNLQFSFSSTLCVPAPPAREGLAGLRSLASKRIRAGPPADVIVIANRAT